MMRRVLVAPRLVAARVGAIGDAADQDPSSSGPYISRRAEDGAWPNLVSVPRRGASRQH